MKRLLLVAAVVALGGAHRERRTAAPAADPPPGAVISDSLDYIDRVPDSAGIVEGKFDTVGGRQVLVTTGTYGFRVYDVSDPQSPQLLDTYQPPEILGSNGYWQDEDMELDVHRKLIIGAVDPRHDDVDQAELPRDRAAGLEDPQPELPVGLLRHLVRGPGAPQADRRHGRAARGPYDQLHRGAATTCGPAGPRGATTSRTSGRSRPARAATGGRSG